jgi:para-aminobenzoate synthetase component 1
MVYWKADGIGGVTMTISLQDWERYAENYSMLPAVIHIPIRQLDVMGWLEEREKQDTPFFALESGRVGRYHFFGANPFLRVKIYQGQFSIVRTDGSIVQSTTDIWGAFNALLQQYKSPRIEGLPKFSGGLVGYFSYDFARYIEQLPGIAKNDLDLPDADFYLYDEITVLDREENSLSFITYFHTDGLSFDVTLGQAYENTKQKTLERRQEWSKYLVEAEPSPERLPSMHIDIESLSDLSVSFTKDRFMDAVRKVQEYISAGDVFQINLSVRQSRKLETEPLKVYKQLRLINPSPYMGYLHFPDYQLISASPELLVKVEGNLVETRPIAGTRPRGDNREEDLRLANELIQNEKERAEHIMLVDLERNDLGRISKFGTVHVNELMVIEEYSHVMHIVSNVRGELAEGKDALDVIAAVFPGGTITGAPKIRTMEIIEELEPSRRGPYTGSIGWIDYSGNMELNIIIRTLVTINGVAHVQAGAGIVIDSDPEKEYRESLNKAKALWRAVQLSEEKMSRVE